MQKVVVKICTGTLCYVMGGSELQVLSDHLPEQYKDKVEIKGATCLDYCNQSGSSKAPFVTVNDRIVENATISRVISIIEEELTLA
ncbi:MAG: NAD(P)H-dependent oxidoreductase subunit E [Rikenellaceae bacterium]